MQLRLLPAEEDFQDSQVHHSRYCRSTCVRVPCQSPSSTAKGSICSCCVVTGARRRDSMTRHLKNLHWLLISYHIDLKIAVLVWSCLNGCAPSNLSSLLNRSNLGIRTLRASSAPSALYDLSPPSTRIKSYDRRASTNYAPTLWNSLPVSIRSSPTLQIFRSNLKTHQSTYFMKLSITSFPVSIESCLQRLWSFVKTNGKGAFQIEYIIIIIKVLSFPKKNHSGIIRNDYIMDFLFHIIHFSVCCKFG